MKRISLSFIAILVVIYTLVCPVYAVSNTFTLTVSPTSKTANLGDTVSFDIGIADIDQSSALGISSVEGKLKFDSDLIESVDIVTINNWSVTINQVTEDEEYKGKFEIVKLDGVRESQVIAKLYAKIRSDATVKQGTITLKDVFSCYGDEETQTTTKTMTINIDSEDSDSHDIIPDNPDNNEDTTPASPDSSAEEQKTPAQPVQRQDTGTKTTTTNTSKATALPKAGIVASGIGIAVLAAIIVAIIELVKYKKTGKQ